MNKEKQSVILAALLHDIGKFWQRSDTNKSYTKHQYLSEWFTNQFGADPLINVLIRYHHKQDLLKSTLAGKNKVLAEIVCHSDTLASKERDADESVQTAYHLESIFNKVGTTTKQAHYQPFGNLTAEKYQFTDLVKNASYDVDVWKDFEDEFKVLTSNKPFHQIDIYTLCHLLKKYLWCIPSSSYKSRPDISLYEHSRLVAAIATCMYDFLGDNKQLETANVWNDKEYRYYLTCFDITGIQAFIYNIAHNKALKSLKGRSFYLQYLMDNVAEQILEALELSYCNLIYSSGGKFYLLLPKTTKTEQVLKTTTNKINQLLIKYFQGDVGLIYETLSLCGSDFEKNVISKKWDDINTKIAQKKSKKFADIIDYNFFRANDTPYGEVILCAATNVEIAEKVDPLSILKLNKLFDNVYDFQHPNGSIIYGEIDDDDNREFISEEQMLSRFLGKGLKSANYLNVGVGDLEHDLLFGKLDISERYDNRASKIVRLNNDDFLSTNAEKAGWKFYGGNWLTDKDFNQWSDDLEDMGYLAVLRMDVDNLGMVFKDKIQDATFSRVVQLSSMLDFFFSGYINILKGAYWQQEIGINFENKGKAIEQYFQIVYSGGDDVFIVGQWNIIPDLAKWIYDEFRRYTNNNPLLTLSAGIALYPDRYPLFKVAKIAEEAEKKAKNYKDKSKDAICFLDTPMKWKDFGECQTLAKQFYAWIEKGKIDEEDTFKLPKAFVGLIQSIYAEYAEDDKNPFGKWRWRGAYRLSRMGKRYKHFEKEINDLSVKLFTNFNTDNDFINILNTAAIWADYLTRKKN